jgi:hypothetical protein
LLFGRASMPFKPDQPISIAIRVNPAHPELLAGLDAWLQLGLISDAQVKQICQEQLACLVQRPVTTVDARPAATASPPVAARSTPTPVRDFVVETEPTRPARTPDRPSAANSGIPALLQALMAEISVLWLLLLGVFLVVVSSAVLAASQWQNFSAAGQYGILFAYTLAFWGVSSWLGRQPNLQLTARMLQVATLLIIPVNFWMMDGFKLWQGGAGFVVAAIAALILTSITILLLKPTNTVPPPLNHQFVIFNSAALSWLHWGWGWQGLPLIATYIGTVGTALLLFYQLEKSPPTSQPPTPDRQPSTANPQPSVSLGLIALAFGVVLLVLRAVLVASVPINQLGLAIGICGWLLCWLARRDRISGEWRKLGVALLLLGWLVAVSVAPWQALFVSVLGMELLSDRLQHQGRLEDATALFFVGLQTLWLVWRVVPGGIQQNLITFFTQLAGTDAMPQALIGLGVFPYVVVTLLAARQFRRQQRIALAYHTEMLAFLLGVMLTLLSLGNPLVRSLNLSLSFVTLALLTRSRSSASPRLVYLTHIAGLSAVVSSIDVLLPDLNPNIWAGILLTGMAAEWGFSALSAWRIWRQSAWFFGIGLAAASYLILINSWFEEGYTSESWVVAPVALTLLAHRSTCFYPRVTVGLSSLALILLQPLMLSSSTTRLLGWGIATVLMVLNTRLLQTFLTAALTIGFGLGFSAIAIWEIRDGNVSLELALNLFAGAAFILWLLQSVLVRRHVRLFRLYAVAADRWAVAISTIVLMALTLWTSLVYSGIESTQWNWVLAAALTLVAISYRSWHHHEDLNFYGIGWSLELTLAGFIALTNASLDILATANLALALLFQLMGDWLATRRSTPHYPSSWHLIPLLYALLGLVIQHREFTEYTGIYTIAAALVGIGIGRRRPEFRLLTYFAILGISTGAYELLIYQLMQAEAGSAGDGITLLAALAAGLAIGQRLLSRWLTPYLRLSELEVRTIANFHWIAGSGLQILAFLNPLSNTGDWLWVGTSTALATYALASGRTASVPANDEVEETLNYRRSIFWTYAGIGEAILTIAHVLHLFLPDRVLEEWGAAVACIIAFGMYVAPWERWGWLANPWKNAALLLPAIVVLITTWEIAIPGLLITAAFYAWIARISDQTRLSYLSVLLADWAIVRFMLNNNVAEPLWYSMVAGASLLYVAQVDPDLRASTEREKRHWLRCLAVGLVCLTALYESDDSILLSLFTLAFSIALVIAGLVLRVRAFLYIGTLTFMIKVLRQVWVFLYDYSLALWAIGIVLGLLFMWIAATFEARRSQVIAFLQYWFDELQTWE